MLMKPRQIDLSRRATNYFFAFGLLAVAWFLAGLPTISRAVLATQTESACVTRLGKEAHRVLTCQMKDDLAQLQALVEALTSEGNLAYCAVVSPEGRYLAHSIR